jgi:hypothetical protein
MLRLAAVLLGGCGIAPRLSYWAHGATRLRHGVIKVDCAAAPRYPGGTVNRRSDGQGGGLKEKGPTRATGASAEQLALCKKMAEELIIEESRHEALEEMCFWPAVREHLSAGDTLADTATEQEQAAKRVLTELDKLQADDAEFERLLATFITDAREHIAFEETQCGRDCAQP